MLRKRTQAIIKFLTLSALCIFQFTSTFAKYHVTLSYGFYNELVGATDLSYSAVDSGYYYQANFTFPVFNRTADFNQNIAKQSNGGFVSGEGYLAVYESPDYINTIVFQCLFDRNDFKAVQGVTKISVKMEGSTVGSRILKFQWKDVVNKKDLNQKINFQVWLNETDSSVSYHYGPNSLDSQANQAYTGIIVLAQNFYDVYDECNVEGSPSNPAVYDTFKTVWLPTLDSIPRSGTIYTFSTHTKTSINKMSAGSDILSTFPNPANSTLSVSSNTSLSTVALIDVMGKIISEMPCQNMRAVFNTADLPPGVYMIKATNTNASYLQKVIISH